MQLYLQDGNTKVKCMYAKKFQKIYIWKVGSGSEKYLFRSTTLVLRLPAIQAVALSVLQINLFRGEYYSFLALSCSRYLLIVDMSKGGGGYTVLRLPTSPFSLVFRKEFFDCPQRDSYAVHPHLI
jgi:hypothetical protein